MTVSTPGASFMEEVVESRNIKALSPMIEFGVDRNTRSPSSSHAPPPCDRMRRFAANHRVQFDGDTLLHLAARSLIVRATRILLAAGAHEGISAFSELPADPGRSEHCPPIWSGPTFGSHHRTPGSVLARNGPCSPTRSSSALAGSRCFATPEKARQVVQQEAAAKPAHVRQKTAASGLPMTPREGDGVSPGGGSGDSSVDIAEGVWVGPMVRLGTVLDPDVFRAVMGFL